MNKIYSITNDKIPYAALLEKQCLDTAWSEIAIKDFLKTDTSIYLCAETEGEISGILSATVTFGEAEIENIAVNPKYRRQGIGRMLVDTLKDSCEKVFLLVNQTNGGAIEFYTCLGFEKVGVRKKYYRGEDALIMELKVKK